MAIKIQRKNNGLNNAARGLERGLQYGIPVGMAARQNAAQEENRKQLTALAVQQAKQVSDQLDRELQETQAAQGAYGELAAGPVGRDRVAEIAKRMDPQAARLFLQDAQSREVRAAKEKGLKGLTEDLATITSEGAMKSDPEARPWMTPEEVAEGDAEVASGLERLNMMAADPDADPVALQQDLGKLQKSRAKAEGAARSRGDAFVALTNQANAQNEVQPFNPAQGKRVRTMLAAFRQNPRIADDPQAYARFQADFGEALQGYTKVGGERVRFEDEETFRRVMMEREELKNRLLRSQTTSEDAQGAYYRAGAQGKLTPTDKQAGRETEAERMRRAMEFRKLAEADNTDEALRPQYRAQAEALERGDQLLDTDRRAGRPPELGPLPAGVKPVKSVDDAAAQVRALIEAGDMAGAERLAEQLAGELERAGG